LRKTASKSLPTDSRPLPIIEIVAGAVDETFWARVPAARKVHNYEVVAVFQMGLAVIVLRFAMALLDCGALPAM
jgi:hypothetical protein